MKGRIYDPEAPALPHPRPHPSASYPAKAYNRYSYVQNNPATVTDPTGFVGDPSTDGTGPFIPKPDYDTGTGSWALEQAKGRFCAMNPLDAICRAGRAENPALNGSFNATPTTSDAAPAPSSDDDNSSTADDDSVSADADMICESEESESQECSAADEEDVETNVNRGNFSPSRSGSRAAPVLGNGNHSGDNPWSHDESGGQHTEDPGIR